MTEDGREVDLSSVLRHLITEGSAEWSATGPENQGDREVRGSIPQPSAKLMQADRLVIHAVS